MGGPERPSIKQRVQHDLFSLVFFSNEENVGMGGNEKMFLSAKRALPNTAR